MSIETKLGILESLTKVVSANDLTEQQGIGKSTITDLRKNDAELCEFAVWNAS